MAAGVVLVSAVAIGLGFARESPPEPPGTLAWILCGVAVVALAAGWTLPADSAPRRLVTLALREAAGLLGAVITIMTGSGTWAAALGLLSAASILAGVAAAGADSAGPSAPRPPGRPAIPVVWEAECRSTAPHPTNDTREDSPWDCSTS